MNAGMKLGKTTRSVLLVLVALIVGGAIVLGGYWRWKYPYGRSHCCIIQMMFALARYADDHGGRYPAGEATPEASLSLLYRGEYMGAYTLSGMTVPPEKTEAILKAGRLLGPDSCGWHYVEGLTKADDPRLGLLWCKEPLGHNGGRTRYGGRQILRVDGSPEWVSGSQWPDFLAEQERLLSQRGHRAKESRPVLTAHIMLPDGTVTNAFRGPYTMARTSSGPSSSSSGSLSANNLDPSQLVWYHPELDDGTVTYTLSFSNLISEALSVEFRDGVAVPEEITFRMKTVSSPLRPPVPTR